MSRGRVNFNVAFVFRESGFCKVVQMVKLLAEWCGELSSEVADPWEGE
jgi:hypothetical protein